MKFLLFFLILVSLIFLVGARDVSVYQGQYYLDDEFQVGTFEFRFDIYNQRVGGDLVYSRSLNLTTGERGEWYVELEGVSSASNNPEFDYFMEIYIDNELQSPRRMITNFDYLRRDSSDTIEGSVNVSQNLYANNISSNYFFGDGFGIFNLSIQDENLNVNSSSWWAGVREFSLDWFFNSGGIFLFNETRLINFIDDKLIILNSYYTKEEIEENFSKINLTKYYLREEVDLLIPNLTDYYKSNEVNNLFDNLNISNYYTKDEIDELSNKNSQIPFILISTINGGLRSSYRYLPLGTNVAASNKESSASFIVGKDLVVTDIYFSTKSNSFSRPVYLVLLKSSSNKDYFYEVGSFDIFGKESGEINNQNIEFFKGDLMLIGYDPYYNGKGVVEDLSVTIGGYYL